MEFWEKFGDTASGLMNQVIDLLPKSPIVYLTSNPTVSKYLGYINWIIPIYSMLTLLEGWLTAIVVYYVVQIVLRWIKAIE